MSRAATLSPSASSVAPRETPRQAQVRRSVRLNKVQGLIPSPAQVLQIEEHPARKRRKIIEPTVAPDTGLTQISSSSSQDFPCPPVPCGGALGPMSSKSTQKPSQLLTREKTLLIQEQEFQRKSKTLDDRLASLLRKEEEASLLMEQFRRGVAKAALEQLEEHFTCALCYEIMACPYSLNPGRCGHSFCALCVLKWFFSRLHKACGGWHESVDCPICRSLLIITPDRVPRPEITFPFTPNRTADTVVRDLVQRLSSSADVNGGPRVKRDDETLQDWEEGGRLKGDWKARDARGRQEMTRLVNQWSSLSAAEFILFKDRLAV